MAQKGHGAGQQAHAGVTCRVDLRRPECHPAEQRVRGKGQQGQSGQGRGPQHALVTVGPILHQMVRHSRLEGWLGFVIDPK